MTANIYLNFDGNCEEAFNFYARVFNVEFNYIGRFSEIPGEDGARVPEADKNKIMHVGLQIGDSTLMGSDSGQEWSPQFKSGNNFSISINTDSKEEADRIFNTLSDGGTISMPMNSTFWGDYFGMFCDKFGVNWMISFKENA